jgi:hypothetical protein
MMNNTKKKVLIGLLAFATIACIGAIAIESQARIIRRLYDNLALDNRNHYLSCEQLLSEIEVLSILQQHQDVVQAIEAVNPGSIGIDVDTSTCPGRADLLIWYASHQNRLEIERLIDGDTFFGVPYRLQNR